MQLFQNKNYYRILSQDFKIYENVKVIDDCNKKTSVDSINYRIVFNDYKLPANLHGFSGAPVFVRDRKSSNWFFYGELMGGDKDSNFIIVVKRKYLLQLLKI